MVKVSQYSDERHHRGCFICRPYLNIIKLCFENNHYYWLHCHVTLQFGFQYKNIDRTFPAWSERWIPIKLVLLTHTQPISHIVIILLEMPVFDTLNKPCWNQMQRKEGIESRWANRRKEVDSGEEANEGEGTQLNLFSLPTRLYTALLLTCSSFVVVSVLFCFWTNNL